MKLIVGLGNPGKSYKDTRHNIGWNVAEAFGKQHKARFRKERFIPAQSAKIHIGAEDVLLAFPLTYMNLSGQPVGSLIRRYKIDLEDLLVIFDDLDLELGKLKIKPSGSSGGHNGVKSVISVLKNEEFCRLRIGIGRPQNPRMDIADYVLSPFEKKDKEKIQEIIREACLCAEAWIIQGTSKSMNIFNR